MQIELPEDDTDDRELESATTDGSSTLGFAGVDGAESDSTPTLIQRLPGRQAFALGFVTCILAEILVLAAAALLF